jgi:hypothetical protein
MVDPGSPPEVRDDDLVAVILRCVGSNDCYNSGRVIAQPVNLLVGKGGVVYELPAGDL